MKAQITEQRTTRDFKCPCGKCYLSYPALFTHIKFKHDGNAPGEIEKPFREPKPRGRPSLGTKRKNEQNGQASKQTDSTVKQCVQTTSSYQEEYEKLFTFVKEIIFPQPIREEIWEQVDSFKEYEKFIDKTKEKNLGGENGSISVGMGLTEFLKDASQRCANWRFEQILILFMLLLQYVMDEQNSKGLIFTQPTQILIEYMNPFMNQHIQDFSTYLQIDNLWGLQRKQIQRIFLCFYNWLKMKEYTSFCITLLE